MRSWAARWLATTSSLKKQINKISLVLCMSFSQAPLLCLLFARLSSAPAAASSFTSRLWWSFLVLLQSHATSRYHHITALLPRLIRLIFNKKCPHSWFIGNSRLKRFFSWSSPPLVCCPNPIKLSPQSPLWFRVCPKCRTIKATLGPNKGPKPGTFSSPTSCLPSLKQFHFGFFCTLSSPYLLALSLAFFPFLQWL